MMLAVTTTARDGACYLPNTLSQIAAQGPTCACLLLSDGPLTGERLPDLPKWEFMVFEKMGARRNGWRAFEIARERKEDLLLLQDDLDLPCTDAIGVMTLIEVPDGFFCLSFYAAHPTRPGEPRIVKTPARRLTGAQALKFPLRSIARLASSGPPRASSEPPKASPHLLDDAISEVADRSPEPFVGLVVPSLVEHVGLVSSCHGTAKYHRNTNVVPRGTLFPGNTARLPISRN